MKKKIFAVLTSVICIAVLTVGVVAIGAIRDIRAQLRSDFTIKIDGDVIDFKNADGETVYPILFEGTTYLPVRAIGEMMSKTVYWYENEKLIELKNTSPSTVTDADVIVEGNVENIKDKGEPEADDKPQIEKKVDTSQFIGEEKAEKIALDKAGLSAGDVTFTKVKLNKDDGMYKYEIEFRKGLTEYEADILATDGTIISWDVDRD